MFIIHLFTSVKNTTLECAIRFLSQGRHLVVLTEAQVWMEPLHVWTLFNNEMTLKATNVFF